MPDFVLNRIRIYPIKACAGTDVQEARMDERGLQHDRRWMLINEQGKDLHQFDYPRLASVIVSLAGDGLLVQAPGMSALHIPLQSQSSTPLVVQWHMGRSEALPAYRQADEWFQDFLHVPCRLVFMPETAQHPVEPGYEVDHERAAFTSFHYHLLGEGSLNDLNRRMATPVPLERFRPISSSPVPLLCQDSWRTDSDQPVHIPRREALRPLRDYDRGPRQRHNDRQRTMTTLARYRTFKRKVLFGQYLLSGERGMLHVGDSVDVLESQEPTFR